jgi:hypothetical protein
MLWRTFGARRLGYAVNVSRVRRVRYAVTVGDAPVELGAPASIAAIHDKDAEFDATRDGALDRPPSLTVEHDGRDNAALRLRRPDRFEHRDHSSQRVRVTPSSLCGRIIR